MVPPRQSLAWCTRLAELQSGYYYPWISSIPPNNGEDSFLDMVKQSVSREKDVLDIGCGHGEVTTSLGPLCRKITGYDRVAKFIDIARERAARAGLANVEFLCADSDLPDRGSVMPVPDCSIDVFICRRGPTDWVHDVPRAASDRAVLIQLNPWSVPAPAWNDRLHERHRVSPSESAAERWPFWVSEALGHAGIGLPSFWTFDVPQLFGSAEEYYKFLSWGHIPAEVPSFEECRAILNGIFADFATSDGLDVRSRRILWRAEFRRGTAFAAAPPG